MNNLNLNLRRKDLVYPDLCYKILGVLFEVWNDLGFGHREKIYQRAVANGLRMSGLEINEQTPAKIIYKDKPVGVYYFDFLIDSKVVMELKVRNFFSQKDIEQLYSYLKSKNLKLGVLAHFTKTGVKYKRIVNIE